MSNLQIGGKAIPFELPGIDGNMHALADYTDKESVVVFFSCNHCPYVRAWEDRMIQIQSDYGRKGVQLIAISSNDAAQYPDDDFPSMKQRAKDKGFNFPYLYDESQQVARAYGAERTPEFFVFDNKGVLHYHGALDDNYEAPEAVEKTYLRDALEAVLSGQSPATGETAPKGCTIKWKK
jgi:peroxiredoxin